MENTEEKGRGKDLERRRTPKTNETRQWYGTCVYILKLHVPFLGEGNDHH
jgi:hypothetical protein